jgi:hypothetical protein
VSTIRRADLAALVDQVRGVAEVGELADPALAPVIEQWLGYVERVVPLFERVAQTMAQLRGVELDGAGDPGAPEGMEVLRSEPSMPRTPPKPPRAISAPPGSAPGAPEVFAALVEALGYCPADMTTGDALELVQKHKVEVMARIKAKLSD